jgi:NitT/TauT family transport system substrate-binding protein
MGTWASSPAATVAPSANTHHPSPLTLAIMLLAVDDLTVSDCKRVEVDAFVKGYNAACDSINKNGLGHYSQLLVRYCKVKEQYADSVTADFKFTHAQGPREKDIQAAEKWINNL